MFIQNLSKNIFRDFDRCKDTTILLFLFLLFKKNVYSIYYLQFEMENEVTRIENGLKIRNVLNEVAY